MTGTGNRKDRGVEERGNQPQSASEHCPQRTMAELLMIA